MGHDIEHMNKRMGLVVVLCLMVISGLSQAQGMANVAVASNFSAPMKELVREFEEKQSGRVRASFASSGKLYAQIKHGAPFHIILSADEEIPQALIANGLAEESSLFTYAVGALVLWAPSIDSPMPVRELLNSGKFDRLALANPKHAPYGRAAAETLLRLNLLAATQQKWVTGENIAQAYHFVRSGNAEVGFVARSQLLDNGITGAKHAWVVPFDHHAEIKQDAVLLRRGKNNKLAIAFLQYLQSAQALEIIRKYGYHATDTRPDINGTL